MTQSRSTSDPRDAEFTALYREHYASVRAYAIASVTNAESDDVVAETFLIAWRKWADIPADWTRGWLIGVARNVVRSRHRATRRAITFTDQLAFERPSDESSADEQHLAGQQIETLRSAMETLKPSDQEILLLTGQYELGNEEIALALGITANAAGVRIHRARERLRSAFREQNPAGGEAA